MLNLDGKRFGRLLVVHRVVGGKLMCQCDCGKITVVITSNLTKGNTTSCGCVLSESRTTHGMTGSPEYKVWRGMRSRCRVKSDGQYRNYGARGITVCDEWSDFISFLKDMGPRPTDFRELDRKDNNKGYSKENCRWVTSQQNLNNKRNNHKIEYNGKCQTISEWARDLGIKERTLNNRINRGWPIERALTEAA